MGNTLGPNSGPRVGVLLKQKKQILAQQPLLVKASLPEFLDIFASFTRSVCQTNVLNLFYMR
jgi:hypothetical protein